MSALKDIRSFVSIAMFLTAVAMWVGAVMTIVASRGSDQFVLRLPDGPRDEIKEAAKANGRSMNAEIVHRLTNSGEAIGPRDWFAALAMGAIISGQLANGKDTTKADCQAISEDAYSFADAMLRSRQSQEGEDE